MSFSALISYFENIARMHKSILHTNVEKHFFRMEIDEVLGGFNRSDVNFPMLILEGYGFDFTDNRSDNILKNRKGAFILLDRIEDPTDFDAKHLAWDKLEAIGDDIINRIRSDKQNRNTIVSGFNIEQTECSLILNEFSHHAGLRYTYTITSPLNTITASGTWIEPEE